MYPEDHNIIGDLMFNLKTRKFFDRSRLRTTKNPDWWSKVRPFWSTASKHGRRVAMFNWHDCKLDGLRLEQPGDCLPYDFVASKESEVQSVVDITANFNAAFFKIVQKRYDVAVVYTDAVITVIARFRASAIANKILVQIVLTMMRVACINMELADQSSNPSTDIRCDVLPNDTARTRRSSTPLCEISIKSCKPSLPTFKRRPPSTRWRTGSR